MNWKASVIKFFIKMTPNGLIIWVSNFILKGIAELTHFNFDIDQRRLDVQTRLYGEEQSIDVSVEDFAIFYDGDSYRFIMHKATSDRPWLNNILAKITGKAWKIPALPQFQTQMDIVADLFKLQNTSTEERVEQAVQVEQVALEEQAEEKSVE
jgi:hypothetical protein